MFCTTRFLMDAGGKSLAERSFTKARCALSGFCLSAAVEGPRVSFSTCTKQDGVERGQLNIKNGLSLKDFLKIDGRWGGGYVITTPHPHLHNFALGIQHLS